MLFGVCLVGHKFTTPWICFVFNVAAFFSSRVDHTEENQSEPKHTELANNSSIERRTNGRTRVQQHGLDQGEHQGRGQRQARRQGSRQRTDRTGSLLFKHAHRMALNRVRHWPQQHQLLAVPQLVVRPATRRRNSYKTGHRSFPVFAARNPDSNPTLRTTRRHVPNCMDGRVEVRLGRKGGRKG